MLKNLKFEHIVIVVLFGWLAVNQWFSGSDEIPVEPQVIEIPEQKGSSGVQYLEPKVVVVQVPSPSNPQQTIDVDKIWNDAYATASQKIKDSLYKEAITVRSYKDTIIDDDLVTITGDFKTRGFLLEKEVDYFLKPQQYEYTPKVEYRQPRLALKPYSSIEIPTVTDRYLNVRYGAMIQNGNWSYGAGYSTQGDISLQGQFTIPLKK